MLPWEIRWGGLLALFVAAAAPASAQVCPGDCQVTKLWFTEVTREGAVTEFVDGWGPSLPPPTSTAGGLNLYTLTPTAEQAADIATALASGCPVEVRFWTRGQLLRSGAAQSGYSAHLELRSASPTGAETLLGAIDLSVNGPPTSTGNYPVEHVLPLQTAPGEGDSLIVSGVGSAYANAVGATTKDYGSAYLKMYQQMTSGAPILQMCLP
jgi:hypothetical protein